MGEVVDLGEHNADEEGPDIDTSDFSVRPAIVPTEFGVAQGRLNNGELVTILNIITPTGMHVTFWPNDSALKLASELRSVGRMTAAGLVKPGSDVV